MAREEEKKDKAQVNGTAVVVNGVKGEEEEQLNEEDQQLKSELEMLVERLKENDQSLYLPALESLKTFIRTSTSSMTAVPKPLKFLRPHYPDLAERHAHWPAGKEKDALADVLSVLAMTYSDNEKREALKYRLLTPSDEMASWGHEYIRHLAMELGDEYHAREEGETPLNATNDELMSLADQIVPFFLSHNAEADAVDLLLELEAIDKLPPFIDANTYARVCLYMVSCVNLLAPPDDVQFLRTAHLIYRQQNKIAQAMTIAIRLEDHQLIQEDLASSDDLNVRKQLAFMMSRQRIWHDIDEESVAECLRNTRLSEYLKVLARELDITEPKIPEDIYKSHLENARTSSSTLDSAKQNLAGAFVNAFVNAGFGKDKLVLVDDESSSWIYKTKDEGMMSAAASVGLLRLWDVELGLSDVDKYMYSSEEQVKAGAILAIGIVNSGVQDEADPALALLSEYVDNKSVPLKVSAILGLGLAYAGANRADIVELLLPLVADSGISMQISSLAALSLGMICVASCDGEVTSTILQTLMERDDAQLKEKWARFMILGLGLLFVGRQEDADATLETIKAIEHPIKTQAGVLVDVCSYAGTGNVLKIQNMLHLCNEHVNTESGDAEDISQAYATLGIAMIAMGEDIGQEMVVRQFGHLMHYGEGSIRKAVPLALGLLYASNTQMRVFDTLSRYSHDNDIEVAINAIFAMGLVGCGTNNARLAQLLRQLASYYHRDEDALFMVRIAQGLIHMGKGTMSINPFHTDRQVQSRVATAGLLAVLTAMLDAKSRKYSSLTILTMQSSSQTTTTFSIFLSSPCIRVS